VSNKRSYISPDKRRRYSFVAVSLADFLQIYCTQHVCRPIQATFHTCPT